MPRDMIDEKLPSRLLRHPKFQKTNENAARLAISRIHRANPGLTMNAAAHVYAERRNFGVYRYLSDEDKLSLSYLNRPIQTQTREQSSNKIRRPREPLSEIDSPFAPEGLRNALTYPYIYVWENSVREVILSKFGRNKTWWDDPSKVSKDIHDYSERISAAETKYPWSTSRGDHPIYYVGLVELFTIIERNWPVFKDAFKDLEQLRAWTKECAPIRNLVAHNIPISNVDATNVRIRTVYLWRAIKRWQAS